MITKKIFISSILALIVSISILSAHEHKNMEHHEAINDTVNHEAIDSNANRSNLVTVSEKPKVENPFKINYIEEAFSHVHNKLVHFPVSLSILGFLFTIFSFKWKQFEFPIKFIVITAAIISIPVIFTGFYQSGNFIGEPKEWIVNIHMILGIMSSSVLWIWTIFLVFNPLKRFAWIIAFISAFIIIITGFYGGIIAH